MLGACGRLSFSPRASETDGGGDDASVDDGGVVMDDGTTACTWGPWSAPMEIAVLNSPVNDYDPSLSADGLTLYFCTTRDGGEYDVFTTVRTSLTAAWSAPQPVPAVATASGNECNPEISADGLELYFGVGTIERVERASTMVPFGTVRAFLQGDTPTQIGPIGPDLSSDSLTLYYAAAPAVAAPSRLFRVRRPSRTAQFGTPEQLPGQTTKDWSFPTVSRDELELVYSQNTGATAGWELGVLSRPDRASEFVDTGLLATINTVNGDADAELSADGTTLMFTSDRPGGTGGWDLYQSTRSCQ